MSDRLFKEDFDSKYNDDKYYKKVIRDESNSYKEKTNVKIGGDTKDVENEYVLGFLFYEDESIFLIRKSRPDWQKGFYNGIGGHIKENENPFEAMVREFKEETGAEINQWYQFTSLNLEDALVFCFWAKTKEKINPACGDEPVYLFNLSGVYQENILPNLHWLIPMARNYKNGKEHGLKQVYYL